MARKKIPSSDLFDTYEFIIAGATYTLREITKSIGERLDEAQAKAKGLNPSEVSSAEAAMTLIELVDLQLRPVAEDGESIGEVLSRQWEADELGLDWLTGFSQTLTEASAARRRPISIRTNAA